MVTEMDSEKIFKLTNIFLGLLVFGEALALIIGMQFSSSGDEWLTATNYILLALDLITGIILIALSFQLKKKVPYFILLFVSATIIGSHIYRNIDYATNEIDRFVANVGLLVFNNIKLLIAFYSIGAIIYILMNWEKEKELIIKELD